MAALDTSLVRDLKLIHARKPLILNLTNYVAMDFCANALCAIGAIPIMSHHRDELEDLVKLCHVIIINIGTLNPQFLDNTRFALECAQKYKKRVVLDPVGCGATHLRTVVSKEFFINENVCAVRANASEINALLFNDDKLNPSGVDAHLSGTEVINKIKNCNVDIRGVLTMSGAIDYIIHKNSITKIYGGDEMMTKVTAMGCTATAVVGAFIAVNDDIFKACAHGMKLMACAGSRAKQKSFGPGSFKSEFIDALSNSI